MLFLWEILTNYIMTWFPGMHCGEKVQPSFTDTLQVPMNTSPHTHKPSSLGQLQDSSQLTSNATSLWVGGGGHSWRPCSQSFLKLPCCFRICQVSLILKHITHFLEARLEICVHHRKSCVTHNARLGAASIVEWALNCFPCFLEGGGGLSRVGGLGDVKPSEYP